MQRDTPKPPGRGKKNRSAIIGAAAEKTKNAQLRRSGNPTKSGSAPLTNQMMHSLKGYSVNISAVGT